MNQLDGTSDLAAPHDADLDRRGRSYLAILFGLFASATIALAVFGLDALKPHDHFSQIALDGDPRWYRNYAHLMTREMQDRDILYHGVGKSIKNAKKADVILLGHSVLEFAIVNDLVEAFEKKHDIRIFNLTNPGIASGEFIRRLIRKWKLKPKVWIINADDYPANFFDPKMDDFFAKGRNSAFKVVEGDWLSAYSHVISRNIRWRMELALSKYGPEFLKQPPYPFIVRPATTFRNVETGNYNLEGTNGFTAAGKAIEEATDKPCPTSDQEAQWGRTYLDGISGTPLFILTPYDKWCRQRVVDLAGALGVEALLSPAGAKFTSFDGRHMNKEGAIAYTTFLLDAFEKSRAFRVLKGLPVEDLPRPKNDPTAPAKICVSNGAKERLFVSVRTSVGVADRALDAGQALQLDSKAGAIICSSPTPFNHQVCPNRAGAADWPCR